MLLRQATLISLRSRGPAHARVHEIVKRLEAEKYEFVLMDARHPRDRPASSRVVHSANASTIPSGLCHITVKAAFDAAPVAGASRNLGLLTHQCALTFRDDMYARPQVPLPRVFNR